MSGQRQLNINGTPVAVTDPTARAMIAEIQALIPSEASESNQLADKDFVNSTAATNTATFRGTYNLVSDLGLTITATQQQIASALATEVDEADNNDYVYVQIPTSAQRPTEIARIDRYKYNGTVWSYEYTLNNSGFTADQWAAINSYITNDLVYKLQRLPDSNTLATLLNGKQDVISDLAAIRSGSQAGATAVQPADLAQAMNNEIERTEEAYAKQTGYYETLGAGTATNLRGVNPTEGTFTFRTSGGSADVATGTAYLERIKGNTVKWNQLLRANKLVDMGLPSGTLWATCDIDVTKADKFCETPFTYEKSFFSWGNVDGHNPNSDNAFDYDFGGVNSNEPYYEGQPYGETQGNTLTGNIPQNADYDAARSHFGASWRMPTNAEFVELLNNTKFINADGTEIDASVTDKIIIVNGVRGVYIESNINGARLFFSCSGYGDDRSWGNRGASGYYWSSAFLSARTARYLNFRSGVVAPQSYYNRYAGLAIRPVTNSAIVTDENDHKYAVSGGYIIDLTLMYGEGNEPSTIAQFEADYYKWFGKPLTSEGYTEGELRDMKMSAIKTIGFNAFNLSTGKAKLIGEQEYEVVGTYTSLTIDGEAVTLVDGKFTPAQSCELVVTGGDSTTCVHLVHSGKRNGENEAYWEETKNVPVTTLTGKLNGEGESVIVFPDGMKSIGEVQDEILIENGKTNGIKRIGSNDLGDYNYTKQGNLYTTDFVPTNANMISGRGKAVVWNQYANSLSEQTKNGITVTKNSNGTLTLNTDENGATVTTEFIFGVTNVISGHTYAMLGVSGGGSNTYKFDVINTISSIYNPTLRIANVNAKNKAIRLVVYGGAVLTNLVVSPMVIDLTLMFGAGNEPTTVEEFENMFPEDYYEYNAGSLGIVADATYPDAESFKAAMQGVPLYYELATPIVYELDNFQLPLPYRVDDYGTEEVTGAENSVAPTLNIRYGINAGDTITNLPKNYISAESIDQLLATMSSAMGGTWTKTWDAANGRYTFSFTPAVTLNLAPSEPEPEEEQES